jgi:competence protein ComEC
MSSVSAHRAGRWWVYVSGEPKGTLTYNSFLRGVREEGSKVEVVRSGRRLDWGGVRADT